jgi:hypothetical protein
MKPQIKELDLSTGEEIVRDATADEIKQIEKDIVESAKIKADKEAKESARQAILDRLGLTADEAKLLLG